MSELAKCNQRWAALRLGLSSNCNCLQSSSFFFVFAFYQIKSYLRFVYKEINEQCAGGSRGRWKSKCSTHLLRDWHVSKPSSKCNAKSCCCCCCCGAASNQSTGGSTKQLPSFTITPTAPPLYSNPFSRLSPLFVCVCVCVATDGCNAVAVAVAVAAAAPTLHVN